MWKIYQYVWCIPVYYDVKSTYLDGCNTGNATSHQESYDILTFAI